MIKKIVPILVIVLVMISFAGLAASAEKQNTITGTIIGAEAKTGKVSVQDENGKMHALKTASSDIDLGIFKRGEKVIVECGDDGVIKSVFKHE